jgi:branched-chain amino acid transport system permease protein
MEFGTRIAEGVPEEVQKNPAVLEAYLGGVE